MEVTSSLRALEPYFCFTPELLVADAFKLVISKTKYILSIKRRKNIVSGILSGQHGGFSHRSLSVWRRMVAISWNVRHPRWAEHLMPKVRRVRSKGLRFLIETLSCSRMSTYVRLRNFYIPHPLQDWTVSLFDTVGSAITQSHTFGAKTLTCMSHFNCCFAGGWCGLLLPEKYHPWIIQLSAFLLVIIIIIIMSLCLICFVASTSNFCTKQMSKAAFFSQQPYLFSKLFTRLIVQFAYTNGNLRVVCLFITLIYMKQHFSPCGQVIYLILQVFFGTYLKSHLCKLKKPEQIQRRCDPLKGAKICGTPPPLSPWCFCPPTLRNHTQSSTTMSLKLFVLARFMHLDRFALHPCTVVSCVTETVLPERCKLCCIGPQTVVAKKGQGMWRALCARLSRPGLLMTVIQDAGGGEMQGRDCFSQPKVAHSPLELFSFCVWWGWCENITSNKRKKKRRISIIRHHAVKESLDYDSKSVIFITVNYYRHRYCFLFLSSH